MLAPVTGVYFTKPVDPAGTVILVKDLDGDEWYIGAPPEFVWWGGQGDVYTAGDTLPIEYSTQAAQALHLINAVTDNTH